MANAKRKLKRFVGRLLNKLTGQRSQCWKPKDLSETERLLKDIDPGNANDHHERLKSIFLREMDCRRRNDPQHFDDALCLCTFLLYKIGDLNDVEMMWEAKNINQDTGVMLDIQYLVGAGIDSTFSYLESREMDDILEYLNRCREAGDLDDLLKWEAYQVRYFYGPQ